MEPYGKVLPNKLLKLLLTTTDTNTLYATLTQAYCNMYALSVCFLSFLFYLVFLSCPD